jgi:hypothetical protein
MLIPNIFSATTQTAAEWGVAIAIGFGSLPLAFCDQADLQVSAPAHAPGPDWTWRRCDATPSHGPAAQPIPAAPF